MSGESAARSRSAACRQPSVRMNRSSSSEPSPKISDSRPAEIRRQTSICHIRSWAWTKPWARNRSCGVVAVMWAKPAASRSTVTAAVEAGDPQRARRLGHRAGRDPGERAGPGQRRRRRPRQQHDHEPLQDPHVPSRPSAAERRAEAGRLGPPEDRVGEHDVRQPHAQVRDDDAAALRARRARRGSPRRAWRPDPGSPRTGRRRDSRGTGRGRRRGRGPPRGRPRRRTSSRSRPG